MPNLRSTNPSLALLAALATVGALALLRDVLEPLLIAAFLSFVAMPALRFGRKVGIPSPITVLVVVSVLVVTVINVGALIYVNAWEFVNTLPAYEEQLRPALRPTLELVGVPQEVIELTEGERIPWSRIFTSPPVVGYAGTSLGGLFGWMMEFFLVLLFLIFIMLDRANGALDRRIIAAFEQEGGEDVGAILGEINRDIERYILVKTGISLLTGVVVAAILTVWGIPFPVLFGAAAFVLNFIPNIGSVLATVPPLVVAYIQLGSMVKILPMATILLILQAGVGNFLDPWMMGRSLRLSPITVLFWLILWNWLWGIPGMILAVPMAVVTRIILSRVPGFRVIAWLMSDEDDPRTIPTPRPEPGRADDLAG